MGGAGAGAGAGAGVGAGEGEAGAAGGGVGGLGSVNKHAVILTSFKGVSKSDHPSVPAYSAILSARAKLVFLSLPNTS